MTKEYRLPEATLHPGDVVQLESEGYNRYDDVPVFRFKRVLPEGGSHVVESNEIWGYLRRP